MVYATTNASYFNERMICLVSVNHRFKPLSQSCTCQVIEETGGWQEIITEKKAKNERGGREG
jgi:hypothetical protein